MTNEVNDYDETDGLDLAIVGMSGRFPGAKNITEFWNNLRNGVETLHTFTDQELLEDGVDPAYLKDPRYVRSAPILDQIEMFDAAFFDFTPSEARLLDPQRRLFLECSWEALEDAGYVPESFKGAIGVFASVGANHYLLSNLMNNENILQSADALSLLISSDKDYFATQVSYKLNLTGPSLNIQTACSSSLVAIHLARQSLLLGECDMALAGGASITIPHHSGYLFQEGNIFSPDGHCRAFDARAKGTIFGSGCGIIVLKRLEDALAEGDHVYALIKGSAINNDGSLKIGYTAPSIDGQAEVIVQALASAGVDPESIGYVEAHGTGTELGDPIEVTALTQAYRAATQKKGYCAIGSVKTNVGHLNTAAGVTGVIKTALAMDHKLLPPSLNFENPNPKIDFTNSPFYVNAELKEWQTHPRRAGVSSLGMGGTNAHVILEEAPSGIKHAEDREDLGASFLVLSAETPTALETATSRLLDHLMDNRDSTLASVAYTLQRGRSAFRYRRGMRAHSMEDFLTLLRDRDPRRVFDGKAIAGRPVIFLFPGQGAQYLGMGSHLYELFPRFRSELERCAELLRPELKLDIRDLLFDVTDQKESSNMLMQTRLAQPILFAVEYSLSQQLMEWGIHPTAMIGHSLGEYTAACLAGVFNLEEALKLVAIRGEIMQSMPPGSMLSVALPPADTLSWLEDGLSVAAVNAPGLCVISGESDAIGRLQQQLENAGVACRLLKTSHAFHSSMMDEAAALFTQRLASMNVLREGLRPASIRFISNVTGEWITPEAMTDPSYWGNHLRQTVRFANGVSNLLKSEPEAVLVEVGPGRGLSSLVKMQDQEQIALHAMGTAKDDQSDLLLDAVLQLWIAGVSVDWDFFYSEPTPQRISLPTYPFERRRHWVTAKSHHAGFQLPQKKKYDIADWFYLPSWKRISLPPLSRSSERHSKRHLIFVDGGYPGLEIANRLRVAGDEVILATPGPKYAQTDEWTYTINPRDLASYRMLISALDQSGKVPDTILHFWNLTSEKGLFDTMQESFQVSQEKGFFSILFLVQALGICNITANIEMVVFTNGLHDITGQEELKPEKGTVLGICKVAQQEYRNLRCRMVDTLLPEQKTPSNSQQIIDTLLNEIRSSGFDKVIAYRGRSRWVQAYQPVPVEADALHPSNTPAGEFYLISGGLFGIGFQISSHMGLRKGAKLLVIENTNFPNEARWEQWLAQNDPQHMNSIKIKQALQLRELGVKLKFATSEYQDRDGMSRVIQEAERDWGPITGIIHAVGGTAIDKLRTISDTNRNECEKNFTAIAQGMIVLDDLFKERDLGFRLAVGSLGSVLGGLGFASYSAASNFMVAFAAYQNQISAQPWTVQCWDSWTMEWETEERVATIVRDERLTERILPTTITKEEGLDAFERVFALLGEAQVAISATDLPARYDRWVGLDLDPEQADSKTEEPSHHPRPALKSLYKAPRDHIEEKITKVWEELLGIEKVGVFDNFYELGGHSLLVTQLATRLRGELGTEFSLQSMTQNPTISNMTSVYVARRALEKVLKLRETTDPAG